MDKSSRSYKILSKVNLNIEEENRNVPQIGSKNKPKNPAFNQHPQIFTPKIVVLSDITIAPNPRPESMSVALENLQEECVQAQKALNISFNENHLEEIIIDRSPDQNSTVTLDNADKDPSFKEKSNLDSNAHLENNNSINNSANEADETNFENNEDFNEKGNEKK